MRRILIIALLFVALDAHAAARYWLGTTSTAWSNTANWGTSSGSGSGASVPTSSDSVILDANGNNDCTANSGTVVCTGFFVTSGYTHTLTCTLDITMDGTVTLGANMLFTASTTNGLKLTPAATPLGETYKSNGVTVSVLITLGATYTYTLSDNWTTTGGVSYGSGTYTLNSNTLYINGGTLSTTTSGVTAGTTAINFGPTGNMTWSSNAGGGNGNPITINTSGTLTCGTPQVRLSSGNTLTYTAGTVVTTGNTLLLLGNCTLNTTGVSWNNVTFSASGTYTLNSLLTVNGTLTISSGITTPVFAGTSGFTCATLTCAPTVAITISLKAGNTYTVTTAINLSSGSGRVGLVKSGTASSSAFLNYNGARSSEDITYFNFTDIDASGGTEPIWAYISTLLRTSNVNARLSGSYIPKQGQVTVANVQGAY